MNVLSIGNSFSEDAQRYIYNIARSNGEVLNTYNLYIGGCPLEIHFRNMMSEERKYELCVNGHHTYFYTSIKDALLSCSWDVVTLQQASGFSGKYESYQPYLDRLVEYIKELCPKAKIAIHQTWAYEEGCELLKNVGYQTRKEMFDNIKSAYAMASSDIGAEIVIPSGELMEKLTEMGIEKVHRDTFHASLGLGRYAIGLLWYAVLTGKDVENIPFCDLDEPASGEEIKIAKMAVREVLKK